MRRKRMLAPTIGLVLLAVVTAVGTLAFYTSEGSALNRMMTKDGEVYLNELFNPQDQWVPGETKVKEVNFGNTGESDQVLRVKVSEKWYDNNGTPDNVNDDREWSYTEQYDPEPAVINWTNNPNGDGPAASDWYDGGDGWYYYKKVLPKKSGNNAGQTPNIIDSVTFSDAISNGGPGHEEDFSDKRYSIEIEAQTLDVSALMTAAEWGKSFTESGGSLVWSASS